MRKYPYTDSTDMIIYEEKVKKPSRLKPLIPCIISAVLSSVITLGAVGMGGYAYLNANNVADGTHSYGRVVDLLLAHYF